MRSRSGFQRIDFRVVNELARPHILAIAKSLAPQGKVIGREYCALNPRRDDRHAGSFLINTQTGRWCDFAVKHRGGDIISFVAYVNNSTQFQAAKWIADWLGIEGGGK